MWDPQQYLAYADERGRPFFDLLSRVDVRDPRLVVDLGCGPGNLTATIAQRWPGARIDAVDSSPEMVAAARANGVDARVLDVREWMPPSDVDVVVSNAVLQWVPDHAELLRRWVAAMPAGSWLAVQMPGNFDSPAQRLARELAPSVERTTQALSPQAYAELLDGCTVTAWETTYLHQLTGEDPVLQWLSGTALRPVRAALDDDGWNAFREQLAPRLRDAYPQRDDGTTWFPFRRVFFTARV